MGRPTAIEFRAASFRRKQTAVLENLSLTITAGETLVLLGRSGSGKTTALKLVNRLLEPSSGKVLVQERATTEWDSILLRRGIGYVIQETGLFPHFTIEKNVGLVPQLERWPAPQIAKRTDELLRIVGLEPSQFAMRYPHELSGGQKQRAGVARALAADPPILLMDEPFGALDPLTRAELQKEFAGIQQKFKKTVVFVTHDLREALILADRIALLDCGSLAGIYSPQQFLKTSDPLAAAYVASLENRVLRSISHTPEMGGTG